MKCIYSIIFFLLTFVTFSNAISTTYTNIDIKTDKVSVSPHDSIHVLVTLTHKEGWYSYWKNPGESGLATKIDWTLPKHINVGDIRWPIPQKIEFGGLINFGFKEPINLIIPININKAAKFGEYKLTGKMSWLVCKETCIPESTEISVPITISNRSQASPYETTIKAYLKERSLSKVSGTIEKKGTQLALKLSPLDSQIKSLYFFPEQLNIIDYHDMPISQYNNAGMLISIKAPDTALIKAETITGIIAVNDSEFYSVTLKNIANRSLLTYASIILFAFLGGLILNIMPCVFPILSLKVLSILEKSKQEQQVIKKQAISYTLGVISCFFAVVSVLAWLKYLGLQLGWGFQLQNPVFVFLMTLVILAVGLNLNDRLPLPRWLEAVPGSLNQVNNKALATGYKDFFTGVLAVIVATPCTAPFMATAIGFALTQSIFVMYLTFFSLAIGFSFPFLLIAYVPIVQKFLPKPGQWMITVKHILAVPLYLTVIWLLWVLSHQVGNLAWVIGGISIALLMTYTTLIKFVPKTIKFILGIGVILIMFGQILLLTNQSPMNRNANEAAFNAIALGKQDNQRMLIDVTASWCVSCKVNENVVLNRPDVKQFLVEKNISLIVLDWTNYDKDITAYLESFNRQGVPLYVYYNEKGETTILPQVLQKRDIFNLVQETKNE